MKREASQKRARRVLRRLLAGKTTTANHNEAKLLKELGLIEAYVALGRSTAVPVTLTVSGRQVAEEFERKFQEDAKKGRTR
jgi:hypothetical protein